MSEAICECGVTIPVPEAEEGERFEVTHIDQDGMVVHEVQRTGGEIHELRPLKSVSISGKKEPTEQGILIPKPLTLEDLRYLVRDATVQGAPDEAIVCGVVLPASFLKVEW